MAAKQDVFFPSDNDPWAHQSALELCRDEGGRIAETFEGPRFVGYTVTFDHDHTDEDPGAVEPEVEAEPEAEPEVEAPKKAAPRKRAAPKK